MSEVLAINHIVRKPESGKPIIAGRGMPVHILIATIRNNPDTPLADLAEHLDLTLGQVHAALSYYHDHTDEIEAIWQEADRLAEPYRRDNEAWRADIAARMANIKRGRGE